MNGKACNLKKADLYNRHGSDAMLSESINNAKEPSSGGFYLRSIT